MTGSLKPESCIDVAPRVSVIVPVYNVERELDRCVASLVGQTLGDLQIVLVDDGSTDGSARLCDLWCEKDARVSVVHKENGGLSSARNAGIESARGDYLGFVDGDDYVDATMYESLLAALQDSDASIACCGRYVHLGDGRVKQGFALPRKTVLDKETAMKEVLMGGAVDVSACDKIYKRELFSAIRYPEGRISEDAAVILQLLELSDKVVHAGVSCYHYCFRDGSISKADYSSAKYDLAKNCIEMEGYIKQTHPDLLPYVESYTCVQMANLIEAMATTPGAKRSFKDDYRAYWRLLRENYGSYISIDGHDVKELVRVVLTRAHLYRVFRLMRLVSKAVGRHGC